MAHFIEQQSSLVARAAGRHMVDTSQIAFGAARYFRLRWVPHKFPAHVAGHEADKSEMGGDDEIRTHDLCSAIAALSQLSYIPEVETTVWSRKRIIADLSLRWRD